MTAPASPHQQPVADSLSAARTSTAADESTRTSQASQPVVVDVVDQGCNTSVGTGERSTPKHTLWVFGRAITPHGLSHPHIYHIPKRTLWVVGRAITPPGLSHPLGAAATSTLSPGLHKIPYPPQDTTPGDNIFKRSNVSPGVCYLV